MRMTRRQTLVSGLAASIAARSAPALANAERYHSIVVGAGVFGTWTAERLRAAGKRVLLVDARGPAHAGASSGGESRLTRAAYGRDEIYTRMAWESLVDWRALSAGESLPLFHEAGVLFFYERDADDARQTFDVHRRLNLPIQRLEAAEMARRWPQVDWSGISFGIYEPRFGVLMARRAVQTLVKKFVERGGSYRQLAIAPPGDGARLEALTASTGERLVADHYVFACGPWFPKLFPHMFGTRIFPTRQEVFFFAPPPGNAQFGVASFPGWADINSANVYYGMPDIEARGFKVATDVHGPPVDPDAIDRAASPERLADARAYLARRFPALGAARLVESRVCQYENSASGDFVIDRHPAWANVVLAGGGSGHGFKQGPAVGTRAAQLVLDARAMPEPRFAYVHMGQKQDRAVH